MFLPLFLHGDRLKRIYHIQLQINGQAFVAKKLVNVGGGRSEKIPIAQAINILTADLIRLKRMAYFAEKFKSLILDEGLDVAGASIISTWSLYLFTQ